jgi:DNA invertase Pin-like site-specific DNA recombinase
LYEDGSTVYEVAKEVGISRQRVSTVLKRAGIEMRRVSPTTAQIDEAVKLYEAGNSLVQIGDKLKFDHGTIWRHLKARGVTMRDTHGREA